MGERVTVELSAEGLDDEPDAISVRVDGREVGLYAVADDPAAELASMRRMVAAVRAPLGAGVDHARFMAAGWRRLAAREAEAVAVALEEHGREQRLRMRAWADVDELRDERDKALAEARIWERRALAAEKPGTR